MLCVGEECKEWEGGAVYGEVFDEALNERGDPESQLVVGASLL